MEKVIEIKGRINRKKLWKDFPTYRKGHYFPCGIMFIIYILISSIISFELTTLPTWTSMPILFVSMVIFLSFFHMKIHPRLVNKTLSEIGTNEAKVREYIIPD